MAWIEVISIVEDDYPQIRIEEVNEGVGLVCITGISEGNGITTDIIRNLVGLLNRAGEQDLIIGNNRVDFSTPFNDDTEFVTICEITALSDGTIIGGTFSNMDDPIGFNVNVNEAANIRYWSLIKTSETAAGGLLPEEVDVPITDHLLKGDGAGGIGVAQQSDIEALLTGEIDSHSHDPGQALIITESTGTDLTGLIKGNGATVEAAVPVVDFVPVYDFGTATEWVTAEPYVVEELVYFDYTGYRSYFMCVTGHTSTGTNPLDNDSAKWIGLFKYLTTSAVFGSGAKRTGYDSGTIPSLSIEDDYLYVLVGSGTGMPDGSGTSIWKKALLFQT
jgi:hypothetical protein